MRGPRASSVGWFALGLLVLLLVIPGTLAASTGTGRAPTAPTPAVSRGALAVPLAAPGAGTLIGAVPPDQSVGLTLTVQPTSQAQLNQLINDQQNPASPYYQQYLTPAQYHAMFDPSPALVASVARYFESYGFTWAPGSSGTYQLSGTAGAANLAFRTTLIAYTLPNGEHAWAPSVTPTLPSYIASAVGSVAGLNTFARPHPDFMLPPLPHPSAPVTKVVQNPAATVTLSYSSIFFSIYGGTTPLFVPPVGMNVSITATVTSGAPTGTCTWSWAFGDGASNSSSGTGGACLSDTVTHEYVVPFNQFWPVPTPAIVVNFADTAGDTGTYNATVIPSMSSQWMERFYEELQMITHGSTGAGTTIGLNEMCDPTFDNGTSLYTSQTNAFSSIMGLPSLSVNYVGNGSTYCYPQWGFAGWAGETLLDMEWAHAMAPEATLEVYFGVDGANMPWANYADIDGGDVLWANNLASGVFVASNSWGVDESTGFYSLFHHTWAQAAAEGLSLFSSSGDCGSTDGTAGLNVSWPASDPYGVAVGGTILQMTPEGAYMNEYVWNGTYTGAACSNNEGTGGGWSRVFTAPTFQSGMPGTDHGWAPPGPAPCGGGTPWPVKCPRGVPDVSADAATWVAVYDNNEWVPTGGTSLASPMWAAMADVMLDAIGYGQRPAGLLDYHIYAIAVTNVTYLSDFHDVTSGTNCDVATGCSTFTATTLWDPASGWGSPNVYNLTQQWNNTFPPWYQVTGTVYSSAGGVLGGATVANGFAQAVTNSAGAYVLYCPTGSSTLTASAPGYSSASQGVYVNASDVTGVDFTLTTAPTYPVGGTVFTESGSPVNNGLVVATQGSTAIGSSGTNGLGQFQIWAPAGAMTFTASAPGLNSSSITATVTGPLSGLVIRLSYTRVTVEGLVISYVGGVPVWGASVIGSTAQGGIQITSSDNSSTVGQFFLHLPEGTGTISARDYPYLPASEGLHVWQRGATGIVIYLTPNGARTTQVNLAVKVIDPLRTPKGMPALQSGSSLTLEIWANNSLTLTPQLGIYLFFSDQALGTFSSVNVSVSQGGAGNPPLGVGFVNYTAPFLTGAVMDQLVVEVGNPGWTGSTLTDLYLVPNFATTCGSSACQYPVWGVVVSTSGQRLAGAQVTIEASCGGTTVAASTSNGAGIYYAQLANSTYYAVPSLSGFERAGCTKFVLNGTPEEVDLVLTPVPPPLNAYQQQAYKSYRNLFTVDPWVILPFLVIAMMLITIAAWRLTHKDEEEKEEKPAAPQLKTPAEEAIFQGAPDGGQALGPGAPPGAGAPPAALPPATPPETPWEITPAPPPPAPDSGLPPLPETPGEGAGDLGGGDSGGDGNPPPPPLP